MSIISGNITLFSYSTRVCKYDNQSDICKKGHKLKKQGMCLSQSIGKSNSTGFEPGYSVCLIDYKNKTDTNSYVLKNNINSVISTAILKTQMFPDVYGLSNPIYVKPITFLSDIPLTIYDSFLESS